MSFDALPPLSKRIAVIGGGISGLASAYLLSPRHRVTLFEAEPRMGGHARTIMAGLNGDRPVDTGFIVFNYANYPHLTRMFHDLNVPVAKSDMSFGVTIDSGKIEYGLKNLASMVGQRRNAFRPGFLGMMRDIITFNAKAEAAAKNDAMTIGDLMQDLRMGDWFQRYYLMPICGAIWSTSTEGIRNFPARSLVSFFRNHALLSATQPHQWWTVQGGSIEYVRRLVAHLTLLGCKLRAGTPVTRVERDGLGVKVFANGIAEQFDEVIFACHSDQALGLLATPTDAERRALSNMRYQDNRVILHRDVAQMPRRRACWSSWIYKSDTRRQETRIGVTYWMNRLQNIPETDPLFVTLNPSDDIPDHLIYDNTVFRHPVFDSLALAAQTGLREIQGQNGTWFAGAYTRHGFHEDGFASAARIARQFEQSFDRQFA